MEIKDLRNREERKIHLDKKLNSEKSPTKDSKAREDDERRFYPEQHLITQPTLHQTVISNLCQTYPSRHIIPGIEVSPIGAQYYFSSPVEYYNVSSLYSLTSYQNWMEFLGGFARD